MDYLKVVKQEIILRNENRARNVPFILKESGNQCGVQVPSVTAVGVESRRSNGTGAAPADCCKVVLLSVNDTPSFPNVTSRALMVAESEKTEEKKKTS